MKNDQDNKSSQSRQPLVSPEKPPLASLFVRDIMQVMEDLAPAGLAEPWDRIGLQLGDPASRVDRVLIALDLTPDVLQEACARQANLVICHHPVIFSPILTIRRDDPLQSLLIDALVGRLNVFVAHTNLDAAPGGVADAWAAHLAEALIPRADPSDATHVGEDPDVSGSTAQATARSEPAKITPYGRMIVLRGECPLRAILSAVADSLPGSSCQVNRSPNGLTGRSVRRVAAFPGSFPLESLPELREAAIDTVICGECKYHDGLALALAGISAISAGHDRSEQPVLGRLAAKLAERLPQIPFAVYSGMDYNKQAN